MVSVPLASALPALGGTGTTSANASSRASPAVGASVTMCSSNSTKSKTAQVNSNGYHPSKAANPLSSMQSAPLDLSSVERRGQPTACKEPLKKKTRPHGLEEGPVFYPTMEEFKDSLKFIAKTRPIVSEYGMCKVVPPPGWKPPFAINTEVSISVGATKQGSEPGPERQIIT